MSLEDIREKKHSKGVYIIIGFLLVGMAGFGTSQFGTGTSAGNDAVLTAGEAEISQAEYQNTLRSVQQRSPNMSAADAQKLTLAALQQRVALSHYINQYPLAASNQQMDRLISNNPDFFDNGHFSDEAFRRVTRVTPAVYRKSLSKDIAIQSLQQMIADTGIISQAEVQPYMELSQLNRDILVAKIARSQFPNTADRDEIQAYYDAHKDQYMTDEKISIEYIDLNPQDIATATAVSDAEIVAAARPAREVKYYVFSNQSSAQSAYEKYQAGTPISTLQETLGDSIEDSGDLGEVALIADADTLIPQNAVDAIYALNKVGDLTPPMIIDETAYLFELSSKSDAVVSDNEKAQAKTQLQAKKSALKIAKLHDALNVAVFETQSPTIDSIATATGLKVTQAEQLSTNLKQGILAVPELLAAIQAGDKHINQLQEPVTIGERVIIYRLTGIESPQQKPFDEVTLQLERAVIAEKTDKQLADAAKQLVEQAKKDGLTNAAAAAHYATQSIQTFTGKVDNNALLDPIAAMMIMRQLPKLGDVNATVINSPVGDAYVYVTTAIRLGEAKAGDSDGEAVANALSGQIGQLELSRFLQSITEHSDIRVNPAMLE